MKTIQTTNSPFLKVNLLHNIQTEEKILKLIPYSFKTTKTSDFGSQKGEINYINKLYPIHWHIRCMDEDRADLTANKVKRAEVSSRKPQLDPLIELIQQ